MKNSDIAFKDQVFTTTQLSEMFYISRKEIHDTIKDPSSGVKGKLISFGSTSKKWILDWDDVARLSEIFGKRKKSSKQIKVIANAKGGVGKSAVSSNLIFEAAYRGRKILAIDLDPQAHLTYNLGINGDNTKTLKDVVDGSELINSTVVRLNALVDVIPSQISLNTLESLLFQKMSRKEFVIRDIIKPISSIYDLVIIDTNPYVSTTLVNALMTADEIIMPAITDFNSYYGLEYMKEVIDELFHDNDAKPSIKIVPNVYDV